MDGRDRDAEAIELLRRDSEDSEDLAFPESDKFVTVSKPSRGGWRNLSVWSVLATIFSIVSSIRGTQGPRHTKLSRPFRWRWILLTGVPSALLAVILFFAVFLPSYTSPPEHYGVLRKRMLATTEQGRGNVNNEKIFIAASLYDPKGELVGGAWGDGVVKLVELLGSDNVHLSIYEDNPEPMAVYALQRFEQRFTCTTSFITEKLSTDSIAHATIESGESLTRRIAFLAEVRNRALKPLDSKPTQHFDKLLYINDVIFSPHDATQLLFSTNIDSTTGRTQYGAVCAMDFINAFKFYDRFAIRDFDGYRSGVPFFPWFTNAGSGISRADVLAQSDAVRVRACWGGMAAFEAKWFSARTLSDPAHSTDPELLQAAVSLRFRAEKELYWEASECCLIMADLTYLRHGTDTAETSGVFVNPYVRVAYDANSFWWLGFTRRFERLYSFPHYLVNRFLGMPWGSEDVRLEQPGEKVWHQVWRWEEGSEPLKGAYHNYTSTSAPGRFCGYPGMQVMLNNPAPGEKRWKSINAPQPE